MERMRIPSIIPSCSSSPSGLSDPPDRRKTDPRSTACPWLQSVNGVMGKIRSVAPIVVPLVSNALARATVLGLTIDIRGYRTAKRTRLREFPFQKTDWLASSLIVASTAGLLYAPQPVFFDWHVADRIIFLRNFKMRRPGRRMFPRLEFLLFQLFFINFEPPMVPTERSPDKEKKVLDRGEKKKIPFNEQGFFINNLDRN